MSSAFELTVIDRSGRSLRGTVPDEKVDGKMVSDWAIHKYESGQSKRIKLD